jgi:methylmalonyl-CoA mutase N-terminal domain/subunit
VKPRWLPHCCGRAGEGNLLDLSIKAVRLRATVGEVSDALEKALAATAPIRRR